MKRILFSLVIGFVSFALAGCDSSSSKNSSASTVKLIFIHHSCGCNWLSSGNGNLGTALNNNNYFVSDTSYDWDAQAGDNLGSATNTGDWHYWFNDTEMPYVYTYYGIFTDCYANTISDPGGENEIVMFKSCYPNSEVGDSIDDEKAIYNGLLGYFEAHPEKLFVLITPPGEASVESYTLTRELCTWLVDKESGWLKDYALNNVGVYDFYCTLSETGSHHTIVDGAVEHVYAADYDGTSPYHSGDDHPNATGNQKATTEFIPLLNYYYNKWQGIE